MRVRSYDTTRPRGFTQLRGSTKWWKERVRSKDGKDRVCISYNAMMSFYSGVCIAIPMQAWTQRTHSDVWSQMATTPECLFKIGDQQSEKKQRNGDRRAICNATSGIDGGHAVIRHRGVSDGSDRVRPLWRSYSARTEIFLADVLTVTCLTIWLRWEQAGSIGSGFAGTGETGFAGSGASSVVGRG